MENVAPSSVSPSSATAHPGGNITAETAGSGNISGSLRTNRVETEGNPVIKLKEVTVVGKERGTSLIGDTQSASQGFIGQEQIKNRPLSRVGEAR